MKNILLLLSVFYFCFTTNLFAQSDSLFTDSTLSYSFDKMMDSCFRQVQ
ncbi:MAG: hypothetical protein IT247_05760 [Bacteroidia bacterium]|nr:hypothetical protein [Bacteroidia bacterium]